MFSDLRRVFMYPIAFISMDQYSHIFTVFNKNRILHFALHVLSNLIGEIPEMDIFRIAGIQHSERILQDHIPLIGTQIMAILQPVRLLLQLDANTVKCDIGYFSNRHSRSGCHSLGTVDILETDIPDISTFVCAFLFTAVMVMGSASPTNVPWRTGGYRYSDWRNVTFSIQPLSRNCRGNSTVWILQLVTEIFRKGASLSVPNLIAALVGIMVQLSTTIFSQGTIFHGSRHVLKYNTVICAFNMTVGDSHIAAVIRINAIAVSQTQIIDNTDSLNQYFLTSHQMSGPECTAGQGYPLWMVRCPYIFQEQQRYSWIKISVNMPFGHFSIEYLLVAVNLAKSGDSHILGILAVYKIQRRFSIVITGIVGRSVYLADLWGSHFQHIEIFQMVTGFQDSPISR